MQEENKSEFNTDETEIAFDDSKAYDDSENPKLKNEEKKRTPLSFVVDLLIYALIIFTCLYVIPTYVMQRTIVDGPSMENTLHDKEQLVVEKISYHLDKLSRFDIVVFYPHGRKNSEYYVKRIIGMPGETLQIIGSEIYINGEVLVEDYGKDPITFAGLAKEPITLKEDEYFVMGDNRAVSLDSRFEDVGIVDKENIGGRAVFRIWPLKKFGFINHNTK